MGSSRTPGDRHYDAEAFDDETPAHEVELTRGFWMGRHPVTNEEYGKFVAETGHPPPVSWQDRRFNEPRQPVVMVSFGDAQAFCAWLGRKGGLPDGGEAVLPTEAQWEYAARGNDGRKYPWGNEAPAVDRAWFGQEYGTGRPADVGGRPTGRSPFGCEDMAGNVWEWCRDDWRERYGEVSTAVVDPCHLVDSGSPRVVRGGSWDGDPGGLRCACRGRDDPRLGHVSLGFRVVVRVPP
ncbi:formylglycine-generating enzyme family protein, partial [Myxococcota bacterium]|nr:formylglycine-generating enzyme family protein [Myxococcota bacterium]